MLSWRPEAWRKVTGVLDPSWQAGLAEGFVRHLQWGPSLMFTFGPYGLVDNILPFHRLTASLAVVYAVGVSWALATVLVATLRPAWGVLGAGVVAWAVLAVANSKTGYADLGGALSLALALAALGSARRGPALRTAPAAWLLLGALGGFTGLQLLTKFNDGLLGVGLTVVLVALAGLPRPKAAAAAFVPMFVVALAAWAGAGQSLGNLWSYLRGSMSIVLGYGSAMALGTGRRVEDYFGAAAIALVVVVFAVSMGAQRWVPGRRSRPEDGGARGGGESSLQAPLSSGQKLAAGLMIAGFAWAALKEGFVRHDTHDLTFFGLMTVAIALAQLKRAHLPLQLGALAAVLAFDFVAADGVPGQLHSPGASTAAFAKDVGAVFGLGGFANAEAALRAQLQLGGSVLPPQILGVLYGRTVAFEPLDSALAYLYPQLRWDPEPVLQGYTAYTDYLDRLNAAFLTSRRAPQRIVYQPWATIDGRDPWLDPPATLESMYCHYAQIAAFGLGASQAQVLGRVPAPGGRCGRPSLLGRVSAHFGTKIEVPAAPGRMVVAIFSLDAPRSAQAAAIALKPPAIYITTWAGSAGTLGLRTSGGVVVAGATRYRFVPGTASSPHVLSTPAALGYSAPFTPPPVTALKLSGGGWGNGHGRVVVAFYALSMRAS